MSLAASQATLLQLHARKSDLEFRGMQIMNAQMILAMKTETIAKEYSDKMNNRVFKINTITNNMFPELNGDNRLTTDSLAILLNNGWTVEGRITGTDPDTLQQTSAPLDENFLSDSITLNNAFKLGFITLRDQYGEQVAPSSQDVSETYYTDDDAAATADYEAAMTQIHVKEKQLEADLKQIELQQKACDTEIDSVKKVLDKDIERSFKTFA